MLIKDRNPKDKLWQFHMLIMHMQSFCPVTAAVPKKPRKFRERAPWEKPDSDEDDVTQSDVFAEGDYLAGRIALVDKTPQQCSSGGRFARIPSKTFNKLRRSISRDISPGSRGTYSVYWHINTQISGITRFGKIKVKWGWCRLKEKLMAHLKAVPFGCWSR